MQKIPCGHRLEIDDWRAGLSPRIAIEAAGKFGWTRHVASEVDVIGMPGFGTSVPADSLYSHSGITLDAIIARARHLISN